MSGLYRKVSGICVVCRSTSVVKLGWGNRVLREVAQQEEKVSGLFRGAGEWLEVVCPPPV